MSRPFCEVRRTFVRCLFVGSTYIWQYSSRSLLYVVFGTLALGISEWLHAEGLKICVDVFFFLHIRKPDCLFKQGEFRGFADVLSDVSFKRIFCGIANHGCMFSFFLFFFFARLTANLKLYVCEKVYDLSVALHLKNEFERSGWNPFGLAWLRAGILSAPC